MKYKLLFVLFICMLGNAPLNAQRIHYAILNLPYREPVVKIIPEPLEVTMNNGYFELNSVVKIHVDSCFYEIITEAETLQTILKDEFNISAEIVFDKINLLEKIPYIFIYKDTLLSAPEEYSLVIDKKDIIIKSSYAAGIFYAIQTLRQLIFANKIKTRLYELPTLSIHDKPRFPFRALMLDPARYFLTIPELERYIDAMAMYKYNKLHLHLTDDQGWRVEIKSLPKLATIGSVRSETQGNGKPHKGFYTQEQLRYIVQYAAERHVEIIPEIDVPGHSVAALAAFPQLSCTQKLNTVSTVTGVSKELLCAGNQQVYDFYEIIIGELTPIFPSKYFHIGGDEAPLDNWRKCPKCQRLMKDKKLKTEQDLMSYFFQNINTILKNNGKEPMFWYEFDVPSYPANSTMYLWRLNTAEKVIGEVNKKGYKLVCAPGEHAYFDYPQWEGDIPDVNWMPTLSLKQTYEFNPTYNLSQEQSKNIIGIEACVWGEYLPNIERAMYMTFPRALAMSEVGWSEMQKRNWDEFIKKLDTHLDFLFKHGVNSRIPTELFINE